MPTVKQLQAILPPIQNREKIITQEQETEDIVNEILDCHKAFAGHYNRIAKYFEGREPERNVFEFINRNFRYREETGLNQTTASPAVILELATSTGVDCKHMSLFAAGVLDALRRARKIDKNTELLYRFVAYDNSNEAKHVFPVLVNRTGAEIWMDCAPVKTPGQAPKKRFFNDRAVFPTFVLDISIEPMALTRLSGIGTSYTTQDDKLTCVGAIDVLSYSAEAQDIIKTVLSFLPEGGLKNFVTNLISDPSEAFKALFGQRYYPSGQYALGEWYLRNILGKFDIQNRGQVPDEIVPQASQFWTLALGVPVSSTDHIDQLAISAAAYKSWANGFFSYVPDVQAERASKIVKQIAIPPSVRNSTIQLNKFAAIPYIFPLFDLPLTNQTAGKYFTGTHPITNQKIVNGYPTNAGSGDIILNDGTGQGAQGPGSGVSWGKIAIIAAAGFLAYKILK